MDSLAVGNLLHRHHFRDESLLVTAEPIDDRRLLLRLNSPTLDAVTLDVMTPEDSFENQIQQIASGHTNAHEIYWDLSAVRYVDAFGWKALVDSVTMMQGRVVFVGANAGIASLAILDGFGETFPFYESLDKALAQSAH